MKKLFVFVVFVLVCTLVGIVPAWAEKGDTGSGMLMSMTADGSTLAVLPPVITSTPDSFLNIDVSGVESWDLLDSLNNTILTEFLGAGSSMTGIGWDLTLETVGGSWLAEQKIYFDGEDLDGTGLFLTPGIGDGFPGIGSYSSGGIIDLSDNGIQDIVIGPDGLLYIQFFEVFDDVVDAVDSFYQAGSSLDIAGINAGGWGGAFSSIPIPTTTTVGLLALFLSIATLGMFVIRREKY